jgi:NAD(P)-dependent dehydrogenase (short-subunit alcohol dehydrogenase family)
MKRLADQRVVITGAAQGLGAAISRRFAEDGAKLVLMDYDGEGLAQTVAACAGASVDAIQVDLSNAAATDAAISQALAGGPVDTLVHNAAILIEKDFIDEDFESFFRTFNVGLQAGYQLAHALWSQMIANGGGSLIFVSSRSGIQGFARESAYCAAKHALEGFSQSLAQEGAPLGITANTITPGMYMRTPMSDRNYSDDLKQKWVDPYLLTPAFVAIAERSQQIESGKRLDAWAISEAIRTQSN